MTKIPTTEECIELLEKNGLTEQKIQHCILVSKVALFLSKKLIEKGEKIDLKLVEVGALLHDVGKEEPGHKANHADIGADILKKEGIDNQVVSIVKKHILTAILDNPSITWEEKLVYYADKRVKSHEVNIVSIDERTKKWPDIFPKIREKIIKSIEKAKELEKEIFSKLDIKPEDLMEMVEK